jgi:hypothetical protein
VQCSEFRVPGSELKAGMVLAGCRSQVGGAHGVRVPTLQWVRLGTLAATGLVMIVRSFIFE